LGGFSHLRLTPFVTSSIKCCKGDVSLTLNNELIPGLTQEEYLTILRKELISESSEDKKSALQHFIDDVTKGVKRKHYTFGLNLNWRDYCLLHWH
jgi:hypothetical protein